MGGWAIIVNVLYPIPLTLLLLLCLPLPSYIRSPVRRFILKFTDTVLFFRLPGVGSLSLYTLFTVFSVFLFYLECLEVVKTVEKEAFFNKGISAEFKEKARCNRWRAERNFWIALLSMILWIVLNRVRSLMHEAEDAKSERTMLLKEANKPKEE
mmetsp:Transcript_26546/g.26793  ORF Transcript_26546/g.26793 Transcript_26546/m.26793 type:complete len:154 (+) Transcript_26546:101-562(+)